MDVGARHRRVKGEEPAAGGTFTPTCLVIHLDNAAKLGVNSPVDLLVIHDIESTVDYTSTVLF